MIPKKHSFWFSEKQSTIIVILEYYFGEGQQVKSLSFADFKSLTVGYISVENFEAAATAGRMKEVSK